MPSDIEDFLKRAAQRRQGKAPPSPPSQAAPRPEYTDARTERIARYQSDEDVPMQATLVDEGPSQSVAEQLRAIEQQRLQALKEAAARRAGGSVRPVDSHGPSPYVAPVRAPSVAPQTATGDQAGFTVADRLVTMLQKPEGMMQAILLQEIMNRPLHRW
ncbi:MAG: hypothetical protein ACO1RT_02280 [Planctomycetaceae bacterium]